MGKGGMGKKASKDVKVPAFGSTMAKGKAKVTPTDSGDALTKKSRSKGKVKNGDKSTNKKRSGSKVKAKASGTDSEVSGNDESGATKPSGSVIIVIAIVASLSMAATLAVLGRVAYKKHKKATSQGLVLDAGPDTAPITSEIRD